MLLAPDLKALIDSAKTERAVVEWLKLKENAWILPHALARSPLGIYAVPEFPFGTDYRADFVVIGPYSGAFYVHFIEMEPPNEPLFTRKGNPADRLAGALTQVRAWKTYVENNRGVVLRELSKFAEKEELLWGRKSGVSCNAGFPLHHPDVCVTWQYHIVIGRRAGLTDKQLAMKAAFFKHEEVEVATYDRLIEAAKQVDASNEFQASIQEQETM
jgi:hypothetical protein